MADVGPHFGQVVDVGLQFGIAGGFRAGADDVAVCGIRRQQVLQAVAQVVAVFVVFDALGNADVFFLRQVDEEASGQRNLGGKPCPFAVDRVFDDLHQHGLPFEQHVFDALGFVGVLPLFQYVDDVQEGRAFQADVDKRALHPGQDAPHHAQINVAHQAVSGIALDVQFADVVFFEHGHARFLRRDIDQHGFRRSDDVFMEGDAG